MSNHADRTASTKVSTCPCCGQPIEGLGPQQAANQIGGYFRLIVEAILNLSTGGRPVPAFEIADRIYRDDPDGGPDDPTNTIRVLIWKRRQQYRALGWDVRSLCGRGGGYSIVRYPSPLDGDDE